MNDTPTLFGAIFRTITETPAKAFRSLNLESRLLIREESLALVFVFKLLLAAALALGFALRVDLDSPRWALITVFIVMVPDSGLVLEKSFYRITATLVGCVAATLVVALFAQHSELVILLLAAWFGLCVCGSVRYRNFQAYAFVLAGYTACILGFPAAMDPDRAFAIMVARGTEVSVGVICAGLVSALVFPRSSKNTLRGQVDRLYDTLGARIEETFSKAPDAERNAQVQLEFIRAMTEQDATLSATAFESSGQRVFSGKIRRLNKHFTTIATRFHLLRQLRGRILGEDAAIDRALAGLDAALASAPARNTNAPSERLAAISSAREQLAERATLSRLELEKTHDAEALVDFDTYAELADSLLESYLAYATAYAGIDRLDITREHAREIVPGPTRVDWLLAGLNGLRAMIATCVLGAFWLLSDWGEGAFAITFATINYGIFASVPKPISNLKEVLLAMTIGTPIAFIWQFFLLPSAHDFTSMFALWAPIFALSGWMITRRQLAAAGALFCIWVLSLAGPENYTVPDFELFLNQAIAGIIGVAVVIGAFALIFPGGGRWISRREQRDLRRQVLHACISKKPDVDERFEHEMRELLRRIGVHRNTDYSKQNPNVRWSLVSLEIGRAVLELRAVIRAHPFSTTQRTAVRKTRTALARAFESPSAENLAEAREAVENALARLGEDKASAGVAATRDAISFLHLIRTSLLDPATPLVGETRT